MFAPRRSRQRWHRATVLVGFGSAAIESYGVAYRLVGNILATHKRKEQSMAGNTPCSNAYAAVYDAVKLPVDHDLACFFAMEAAVEA